MVVKVGRMILSAKLVVVEKINHSTELLEIEDMYRKRAFGTFFAMGTPITKALRQAGFIRADRQTGMELLRDPEVIAVVDKTLMQLQAEMFVSKENIIAQLDSDREFAYDEGNPAAAVAATVAKAKVLGMLDKQDMGAKNMPSKIEITWGENSSETIYEKSNPLLHDALNTTLKH